jgi:FkbM family methyltransferase
MYEPMTSILFNTVLAAQPKGSFVLDIGGGNFHYSQLAMDRGMNVLAFEPRVDLSPKRSGDSLHVRREAVSNINGHAALFYTPFRKYSASIIARATNRHSHEVIVETVTLDSVCWGMRPVAVVKLDIEGAEPLALQGAECLLHANRPVIFIEVLNNSIGLEISKHLPKGYEFYKIDDYNMTVTPMPALAVGDDWNNFMLLPVGR